MKFIVFFTPFFLLKITAQTYQTCYMIKQYQIIEQLKEEEEVKIDKIKKLKNEDFIKTRFEELLKEQYILKNITKKSIKKFEDEQQFLFDIIKKVHPRPIEKCTTYYLTSSLLESEEEFIKNEVFYNSYLPEVKRQKKIMESELKSIEDKIMKELLKLTHYIANLKALYTKQLTNPSKWRTKQLEKLKLQIDTNNQKIKSWKNNLPTLIMPNDITQKNKINELKKRNYKLEIKINALTRQDFNTWLEQEDKQEDYSESDDEDTSDDKATSNNNERNIGSIICEFIEGFLFS